MSKPTRMTWMTSVICLDRHSWTFTVMAWQRASFGDSQAIVYQNRGVFHWNRCQYGLGRIKWHRTHPSSWGIGSINNSRSKLSINLDLCHHSISRRWRGSKWMKHYMRCRGYFKFGPVRRVAQMAVIKIVIIGRYFIMKWDIFSELVVELGLVHDLLKLRIDKSLKVLI